MLKHDATQRYQWTQDMLYRMRHAINTSKSSVRWRSISNINVAHATWRRLSFVVLTWMSWDREMCTYGKCLRLSDWRILLYSKNSQPFVAAWKFSDRVWKFVWYGVITSCQSFCAIVDADSEYADKYTKSCTENSTVRTPNNNVKCEVIYIRTRLNVYAYETGFPRIYIQRIVACECKRNKSTALDTDPYGQAKIFFWNLRKNIAF